MLALDWKTIDQHGQWAAEVLEKIRKRKHLDVPDATGIQAYLLLDGPITTAIVRTTGQKKIASGVTMRSVRDPEDRMTGMRIALTRALVALDRELF